MATHSPDPHGATQPAYRRHRRWRMVTITRRRTTRALTRRAMRMIARAEHRRSAA